MRIISVILILLAWGGRLTAQVDAELILGQDQFLRDEPVPIKLKVTNRSGQTLRLGETNDWVSITIEVPGRGPVERMGQADLTSPFELESAHQATREFNLQPWFDLSQPGRYMVTAIVRIKQWDKEVITKSKAVEIVRGAKLWEQEVGVPVEKGEPEVRRYILQQANYRKQLKLYLRISNASDTAAYNVLALGPLVSFGRPEAQVDDKSNLHVLFQTGARSFLYSAVNANGEQILRQNHDYGATRPTLRLNEAGRIIVAGGVRRVTNNDLPPITAAVSPDKDVATPAK